MKTKLTIITIILLAIVFNSCNKQITRTKLQPKSTINLNQIFSDHMVLQRGMDIHIFGSATPGTIIKTSIAGNSSESIVGSDGMFDNTLPQLSAGGPYELTVSTVDTVVTLQDILIGDIWICSGQSNMEFEIHQSKNGSRILKETKPNQIRIVDIPQTKELIALDDFKDDLSWYRADVDTIYRFSAVALYYGLELEKNLNIPIGLVGSNWGGTNVETWTQTKALKEMSVYKEKIDFVDNNSLTINEYEKGTKDVFVKNVHTFTNGIGLEEKWYETSHDISDWGKIQVPGYWEDQIPELAEFDGTVWYRRSFDTTKDFDGKDLKLWLSQIRDYDMVWINGVKIGETFSPEKWRGYTADKSIIKRKDNILVVRVYNRKNSGGFSGIPAYFDFYPDGEKIHARSLAGEWSFKAGNYVVDDKTIPMSSSFIHPNDYPALLYNAMINPMIKFPIKGAIWYQGEANAEQAYLYRKSFPAMINNWREQWNQGDFPFYFVQIANFGPEHDILGDSHWAELREAQERTLSLPNTGMASIIDIGNAEDIHPINKLDVGKRLAYNALNNTYNINTIYSGPSYKSFRLRLNGSEIIVEFDNVAGGLITNDSLPPAEFIVAGADKTFYNAKAKIRNNTIILSCEEVEKPVSIRYAWKNSPFVNTFNKEGLPMLPFRTDDWEITTFDEKHK